MEKWILFCILVAVVLLVGVLSLPISRLLLNMILMLPSKRSKDESIRIKERIVRPCAWLVTALTAALVCVFLPLAPVAKVFLMKLSQSACIAAAAWLLSTLLGALLEGESIQKRLQHTGEGRTAMHYLMGALRIFIVLIAVILILEQWLSNIGGIIAGLGIGGVALALAAQDTASNLVAGLAIMLDKPYDIGDWVESETANGKVVGTVVSLGLRSTRVRAFDGSLISVPNSAMGNAAVINGTKRSQRLADLELPLAYPVQPETLEQLRLALIKMLEADERILKGSPLAVVSGFFRGGIMLVVRFRTAADYGQHMETKHDVSIEIVRIAQKLGVSLAKPYPET